MNLLEKFRSYIKQQHLFHPKDRLLLAVSGGVDSVVLCELCKQAGYDFTIAHCNFQLRGAESERDEAFVRSLEGKYGVKVLVKKFDTEKYANENKLSTQVAARELRYSWFKELLDKKNNDPGQPESMINDQRSTNNFLLTAHHANDNIETLLMNFFKGTGINGLHGILPKQGKIIRPLLFARKEELGAFAVDCRLDFVEDSSNASDKYTRNYFRNQLIPGLQNIFPQVEQNLLHNIDRFREIETLYNEAVLLHQKKLLEIKGNEIHIPVLKLLKTPAPATMLYEVMKTYGFTSHQTSEAMGLMKSDSGKYIASATHRIIKNRGWLIISPNNTAAANNILIEEKMQKVQFESGYLHFEALAASNQQLSTSNQVAMLDASQIEFPLLLRKWKPGDYFYPLGMKKKKKLSRFLIDQKLSLTQKERTWVIEMNKKIVWVVGMRIDDRFKIADTTRQVLQISLHHNV